MNDINRVLVPDLCFGCNARFSRGETFLCTLCRTQLPLTEYTWSEENLVDRIFFGRVPIENATSLLYYNEKGMVRNIIHALKYQRQEKIGVFLGEWLGLQLLDEGLHGAFTKVIPVPINPWKKRRRGYNQVDRFGQRIAAILGAECDPHFLIRRGSRGSQTKKGRLERWESQQGLYKVRKPGADPGEHVLLVDDVITTGATLEACATSILEVFDTRISIASMAVVP